MRAITEIKRRNCKYLHPGFWTIKKNRFWEDNPNYSKKAQDYLSKVMDAIEMKNRKYKPEQHGRNICKAMG